MPPFYIIALTLIIVFASLIIAWLVWTEKRGEVKEGAEKEESSASRNKITLQNFLQRLHIPKEEVVSKPSPNLLQRLNSGIVQKFRKVIPLPQESGTASLRLEKTEDAVLPPLDDNNLQKNEVASESELSIKYDELFERDNDLRQKYEKLDTIVKEKNTTLEKTEKILLSEQKNRKEFNKIKDILEKELREIKDRYRDLQIELNNSKTEAQSYLKRINQLEEKIKQMDKEILEKEDSVKDTQLEIQKVINHSRDLAEQIAKNEETIQARNKKIEDLINMFKKEEDGTHSPTTKISEPNFSSINNENPAALPATPDEQVQIPSELPKKHVFSGEDKPAVTDQINSDPNKLLSENPEPTQIINLDNISNNPISVEPLKNSLPEKNKTSDQSISLAPDILESIKIEKEKQSEVETDENSHKKFVKEDKNIKPDTE